MTFSPFLVGCMAGSVHSVSFLANEAEHTQRANRIGWFTNQMGPYIKQHGVGWWAGGPFPSISGAVWSMRHPSLRWLVKWREIVLLLVLLQLLVKDAFAVVIVQRLNAV